MSPPTARLLMAISVAAIVGALHEAGLLVATTGSLPDVAQVITDDSRQVVSGTLFIAIHGATRDGHDYLEQAEQAGAIASIVEDASRACGPAIVVRNGRRAAAIAASAAYAWPAHSLRAIGVTGTNGKTTTVNMLRHVLDQSSARSASIGTLGVLVGEAGEELPGGSGLTTPGPVELQRVFRALVNRGVGVVAMEAVVPCTRPASRRGRCL